MNKYGKNLAKLLVSDESPKSLIEEIETTGKFKSKKLFTVVIKYIAPVFIVLILISSVLDALGIVKI